MAEIIKSLVEFCGLDTVPETFPEFMTWFCMFLCAVALLKYILSSLFWLVHSLNTRR